MSQRMALSDLELKQSPWKLGKELWSLMPHFGVTGISLSQCCGGSEPVGTSKSWLQQESKRLVCLLSSDPWWAWESVSCFLSFPGQSLMSDWFSLVSPTLVAVPHMQHGLVNICQMMKKNTYEVILLYFSISKSFISPSAIWSPIDT